VLLVVLLLHWQVQVEDEVGRVTCGGERTSSFGGLVNWAFVRVSIVDLVSLARQNPNTLHGGEEHSRLRFLDGLLLLVPSGAFHEKTMDVDTIFWRFAEVILLLIRDDDEVELDVINGDDVLSGKVLSSTCQEGLGEEETREPEVLWSTIIDPALHEAEPLKEIKDPGSKWLQRWVSSLVPNVWNLVVK